MRMKILIAHAQSETHLAERLAKPLREAGYEVSHQGTVLVGESIVQEAAKILSVGGPVILCGTVHAIGTGWAHRMINAARLHSNTRIYAVQMEKNAYLDSLALDCTVASYWLDPEKATNDLLRVLNKDYPLLPPTSPTSRIDIGVDSLKDATKRFSLARLRLLGRGRYFPDLYVERDVSNQVMDFLHFEQVIRERSSTILDRLQRIAETNKPYKSALERIAEARTAFNCLDLTATELAITELKRSFSFSVVEKITTDITHAIQTRSIADFEVLLVNIIENFKRLPGAQADTQLSLVRDSITQAARRHVSLAGFSDPATQLIVVWQALPVEATESGDKFATANTIIDELEDLRRLFSIHCTAIVGPAGCGKTSLLCTITGRLLESYPTILISGRHSVSDENFFAREIATASGLSEMAELRVIEDISKVAKEAQTWIYIVIDGINESGDAYAFGRALDRFMTETINLRYRFLLSCRDVVWPLCSPYIEPYLSDAGPISLASFSDKEWIEALAGYQDQYHARLSLSSEAEKTLRHPLLLRLFFESHGSDLLGHVSDLRRLSLLATYLQKALERLASRRSLMRSETAYDLLLAIAGQMLAKQKQAVRLSELQLAMSDLEDSDSNYNSLRSEGIIDEFVDPQLGRCVRFTYSELAEYMIAVLWRNQILETEPEQASSIIDSILKSSIKSLPRFELISGALVLLDELNDEPGRVLNQAISLAMSAEEQERSTTLFAIVQMFDHLPPEAATEETVAALELLEREATPQVKELLIPTALRFLDIQSSSRHIRNISARILGLDEDVMPNLPTIEDRHRNHIIANEENHKLLSDEKFQKDYCFKPEIRKQSMFCFRFTSERFTKLLIHDSSFARTVFEESEGLYPDNWEELLATCSADPEFARSFKDISFRKMCLREPEMILYWRYREEELYRRYRDGGLDQSFHDDELFKRYREKLYQRYRDEELRLPPEHFRSREFESENDAKLKDKEYIERYLKNFEVREMSGRLLELQSKELRELLFTNSEFRNTYLGSAHFRELWFRNSEKAWEFRSHVIGSQGSPDVSIYVKPQRHRYDDTARLNALNILARNEDEEIIELMVAGIREMRVRHAITAFREIDRSTDKVAIEIARQFARLHSADYVVFSGWLLRTRFGKVPAEILIGMLCHPLTRVHRYAMRLFEFRDVEDELFEAAIQKLEEVSLAVSTALSSWHVVNLCRLVTKGLALRSRSVETMNKAKGILLTLSANSSGTVSEAAKQALSAIETAEKSSARTTLKEQCS